ncbi:hypothetical protein [Algibacillus agarilyticus]|uniref:hypothetical protein n=1 Tax=Algibacillus agarilyticus TaxID=2234133 RepID=UPI001300AFF3|nr:hypothetical protein [Algibacillus agarilyticus]
MVLDKNVIEDIKAFRRTLESFSKSDFPSKTSFYNCSGFPRGCCGDTAGVLGLLLTIKHKMECFYVSATGLGSNNSSHAWLEVNGSIVDITADQFNEDGYEVGAVVIGNDSHFHTLFHKVEKRLFDPKDPQLSQILAVYQKVIEKINAE